VLRCGGGRALTKQLSDETALRFHVTLEERNKVSPSVTEATVNDALAIHSSSVRPEHEGKRRRALGKAKVSLLKSRLGRIMRGLYDLESDNEPEKPLNVDFGLYQMENF
jgi:hypothetical protein